MVCPRCIHVVKQILAELEIKYLEVELGYAVIAADQPLDLDTVNQKLETLDLGLVRDQNEVLVTEIDMAIHDYLENISLLSQKRKLSEYIALELGRNYHQLSKIYSQFKGETIEQCFIALRTNKVKELIKQGKLNLSQIAVNVGYSSIHYLSGQFKKYTGISLSQYKREWEASLTNSGNGKEPFVKKPEKKNCDCGCEDCNCGRKNGSSSIRKTSSRSSSGNSKKDLSMTSLLISVANSSKYSIHVSR
jgi:AraC-like DNA-binding protein